MKRCPQCSRTYEDAKNFCLQDGAPLVSDSSPLHSAPTPAPSAWSQAGDWQQQPTNLSGAPMRKRKVWPWVVGVLSVLIIGGTALVGGIGYYAYKAIKQAEDERRSRVVRVGPPAPVPPPKPVATKSPRFGPAANAPTDRRVVLGQLTEIEKKWARANIEGDREALEEILAAEYVTHSEGGGVEDRADYLKNLSPNPAIESQEFEDSTVAVAAGRAVLTGVTIVKFADERIVRYRFVDTFVWRDGRWQAMTSTTSRTK